ncbi:MAG: hypothetical protein KC620_07460 [Myxococcales bacterium]|nr:hypothetical protein [Myxococcales bacterium]
MRFCPWALAVSLLAFGCDDDEAEADAAVDDMAVVDMAAAPDQAPAPDQRVPDAAVEDEYSVCTAHTPSAPDCKDCCDCLDRLTCDGATACREACDALPPDHWAALADQPPTMAPSTLGPNGDYSACFVTGEERACKACCCDQPIACGDLRHCRTACNEHDFGR